MSRMCKRSNYNPNEVHMKVMEKLFAPDQDLHFFCEMKHIAVRIYNYDLSKT